jgi:copper chaperone CopZ
MYAIKPYMDNLKGIKSWDVDLESKDKIVEVVTDTATPDEIKEAIEKAIGEAGYSAQLIN